MTEKQDAIELANRVLDTPNRDPDDDLSMMSRQFLRAIEPSADDANLIGGTLRSDIIYKFAGWLTTREATLTLGATHEAASMAEAVAEYLASNP